MRVPAVMGTQRTSGGFRAASMKADPKAQGKSQIAAAGQSLHMCRQQTAVGKTIGATRTERGETFRLVV